MGFYETGDGRWIQLHMNFKHHRDGVVKLLGCSNDYAGVTQTIRGWNGASLDEALADAGLCAALIRTPEEWALLPQTQAIAEIPLLERSSNSTMPRRSRLVTASRNSFCQTSACWT